MRCLLETMQRLFRKVFRSAHKEQKVVREDVELNPGVTKKSYMDQRMDLEHGPEGGEGD